MFDEYSLVYEYLESCIRKVRKKERFEHSKFVIIPEKVPGNASAFVTEFFKRLFGLEYVDFLLYRDDKGRSGLKKTFKSTVEGFESLCRYTAHGKIAFDPDIESLDMCFMYMYTLYGDYKRHEGKFLDEKELMTFSEYCEKNVERNRNRGTMDDVVGHGFESAKYSIETMKKNLSLQIVGYGPKVNPKTGNTKITGKGGITENDDLVISLILLLSQGADINEGRISSLAIHDFFSNAMQRFSSVAPYTSSFY